MNCDLGIAPVTSKCLTSRHLVSISLEGHTGSVSGIPSSCMLRRCSFQKQNVHFMQNNHSILRQIPVESLVPTRESAKKASTPPRKPLLCVGNISRRRTGLNRRRKRVCIGPQAEGPRGSQQVKSFIAGCSKTTCNQQAG